MILITVLVAFISLSSCSSNTTEEHQQQTKNSKSATESDYKTYTSDSLHLSFNYPPDWEVRLNGNRLGIFEPLKDSTDAFQENIMIWIEEMPMQISDTLFGKAATTEIKIKNPNIVLNHEGLKKLGDQNFYHFEFDYTNSGNSMYHIFGYTLVNKKRGYNFSCTSEIAKAGIHSPLFESILSSFKPL